MSTPTPTASQQQLLDVDPTQQNGAAGMASAEAARLMASLELLNAQFKEDEQKLLQLANQATVSQANDERSQGNASAVGSWVSMGIGAAGIGHAVYTGFGEQRAIEKETEKALEPVDNDLKQNAAASKANEETPLIQANEGESEADRNARADRLTAEHEQNRPTVRARLAQARKELKTKRADIKEKGQEKKEKAKLIAEARSQVFMAGPQSANGFAQAHAQAYAAKATEDKAVNSLATSADQSLDSAAQGLRQTGEQFNQINFFAAAVAASRA